MENDLLNKLQDLEKERLVIQHCESILNDFIKYKKEHNSDKPVFITEGLMIEKAILCQIINRLIYVFENQSIVVSTEIKIDENKSYEYNYIRIE